MVDLQQIGEMRVRWVVGTGSYILTVTDWQGRVLHNRHIDQAAANRLYHAALRESAEARECQSVVVGR